MFVYCRCKPNVAKLIDLHISQYIELQTIFLSFWIHIRSINKGQSKIYVEILFSRVWHRIVCQIVANLPSLKMEAASSPEMMVAIYQTNWAYTREDSIPHSHRRWNLKSYKRGYVLRYGSCR
jgi:hypothetical protein